ncbi:MAG: phosphoglycolate phosphatase [Gammaproteobacteria bacterium]|nr:phosphoglycolate phosphatase [Gammaproteobacteria bacterium]
MSSPRPDVTHVLFDLDGTLLDTAPDLAYALNALCVRHGRPALPYETIRPQVSHGGAALVRLGFGIDDHAPGFEALRRELLDLYHANVARASRLFDGMDALLETIERAGLVWGIVTNKPGWLTAPLLDALGLESRPACVVSGDTLPQRKPHPAPLLHAAACMDGAPARCLYIGDAARDIEAGHAAGMITMAALYGYIPADEDPLSWNATAYVATPPDIGRWLALA